MLFATTVGVSPASAEQGGGDYRWDPRHAPAMKALSDAGDDVIRFSSQPALGGYGWAVEIHRVDAKRATGEATFWREGPRDVFTRAGRIELSMSANDYDQLSARVDALLIKGEPPSIVKTTPTGDTVLAICTDGPGYLTERRRDGRSRWLSGSCGDHPNEAIAKLISEAVLRCEPLAPMASLKYGPGN